MIKLLFFIWMVVCFICLDDQLCIGIAWPFKSKDVMISLFMMLLHVLLFVHDVATLVTVEEP